MIAQLALSQSQSDLIKQLREENTKLKDYTRALCAEIKVIRDSLFDPNLDSEPDNIRLHHEKCHALNRALKAETELHEVDKAFLDICEALGLQPTKLAYLDAAKLREKLDNIKSIIESAKYAYPIEANEFAWNDALEHIEEAIFPK